MAAPAFLPIISKFFSGFTARMAVGLGKEGKKLTSVADKFVYGFGKGFQDSFYRKANAVRLGQQFSDTIGKMFEHVFGAESAKSLRQEARSSAYSARRIGVSGSGLSGFGQALGMYGGGEGDLTGSIKSLNAKMTGLNYGNAEFLKQLMLMTQGQFNIYGSGPRGFKTGAEMQDEFARWAEKTQKSGTFDPGVFENVADQLGISGPIRDATLDGEYANMKARRVLTQEEMDNAANMGKAQKRAEIETTRLKKRLGVIGSELRQPLDELSIYIQKNLFGWIADKLTPDKTEKEVKTNVKDNAAAIDATLIGNDGGFTGDTARNNRQEAAMRLHEKYKAGAMKDEEILDQSVIWAMAQGLEKEDEIRKAASMMYSAAKSGDSWKANDSVYSNNKEFDALYDKNLVGVDIISKLNREATAKKNEEKLNGYKGGPSWWTRTVDGRYEKTTGERTGSNPLVKERENLKRVIDRLKNESSDDVLSAETSKAGGTFGVQNTSFTHGAFTHKGFAIDGLVVSSEKARSTLIERMERRLKDLDAEAATYTQQTQRKSRFDKYKEQKPKEDGSGSRSWLFMNPNGKFEDSGSLGKKVSSFTAATNESLQMANAKAMIPAVNHVGGERGFPNVGDIRFEPHITMEINGGEAGGDADTIVAAVKTNMHDLAKEFYADMASQISGMLTSESQYGVA